jgi:hypothetical protein
MCNQAFQQLREVQCVSRGYSAEAAEASEQTIVLDPCYVSRNSAARVLNGLQEKQQLQPVGSMVLGLAGTAQHILWSSSCSLSYQLTFWLVCLLLCLQLQIQPETVCTNCIPSV